MVQKNKEQYKVHSGPYKNKAHGLKFGYEYTSGNETSQSKAKEQSTETQKGRP